MKNSNNKQWIQSEKEWIHWSLAGYIDEIA